jgi:hypothetical protein
MEIAAVSNFVLSAEDAGNRFGVGKVLLFEDAGR